MTLKFKNKTTMKTLFSRSAAMVAVVIFTMASPSGAQNTFIAGPDTSLCGGAPVTLWASMSMSINNVNTPVTLNGPLTNLTLADDQWSTVINLPFPFTFYGNVYNQCLMGSNGAISFNTANASAYNTWPINAPMPNPMPADMRNTIMSPWEDLFP